MSDGGLAGEPALAIARLHEPDGRIIGVCSVPLPRPTILTWKNRMFHHLQGASYGEQTIYLLGDDAVTVED